jgi:hypothetical protein
MSFVFVVPHAVEAAAADLAGIGSTISSANAAAAAQTTGMLAAAEDEVSMAIAALFSEHGQGYQQLSAEFAGLHEQLVETMTASAGVYATAEVNAVKTLANELSAPAEAVLGHLPAGGGANWTANLANLTAPDGAFTAARTVVSNAVGRIESVFLGPLPGAGPLGGPGPLSGSGLLDAATHAVASPLTLRPTAGISAFTGGDLPKLLSSVTNAAAPVALAGNAIGTAIENAYNAIEPWVQYGFQLLAYAVGWVPFIGILAPQINFLYNLFEPIVQSALFNTIDWLSGSISFGQGLANFWSATTSSVNYFIQTEINWVLSFFPPLPPLP